MKRVLIIANALLLGCGDVSGPLAQLDEENAFNGAITTDQIGRFVQRQGEQPGDHQSAQTFTVRISGRLTRVRVPLTLTHAVPHPTAGATMDIVAVNADRTPDESRKLGEASVPAAAFLPTHFIEPDNLFNPNVWVVFDFTNANIDVTASQQLAFIIRSTSTSPITNPVEHGSGYERGSAFRRNRAVTAAWTEQSYDYLFQTFVIHN